MNRLLIVLLILIVALGAAAWYFRDVFYFMSLYNDLKIETAFDEQEPPPAPDYKTQQTWAALPDGPVSADFRPTGLQEVTPEPKTPAFFIHPTTHIQGEVWNAPFDHPEASQMVDGFVVPAQASAFAGCCDVYVPRYRQATFFSFFEQQGDGLKAIDFAYGDIDRAFTEFLERIGPDTPFILAGHSQGAFHVLTLLERRIGGTPLQDLLVAAYPVGTMKNRADIEEAIPTIPLCTSAGQTGCYASWNTVGTDYMSFIDMSDLVCVNPLTWTADDTHVPHSENLGAYSVRDQKLIPAAADAQCSGGLLVVSEIRTDSFDELPFYMGKGNHHLLDFSLFWANIRANAIERAQQFE